MSDSIAAEALLGQGKSVRQERGVRCAHDGGAKTAMRKPRSQSSGFVWCMRLLRRLLVRDDLEAVSVRPLLIVGQHDHDAIGKGLVLQGDGKSSTAFERPGRANARPDFLAALVFARGLAVVEDIGRCVWHMLFSVAQRCEVSRRGHNLSEYKERHALALLIDINCKYAHWRAPYGVAPPSRILCTPRVAWLL